jgi:hypothetical protein
MSTLRSWEVGTKVSSLFDNRTTSHILVPPEHLIDLGVRGDITSGHSHDLQILVSDDFLPVPMSEKKPSVVLHRLDTFQVSQHVPNANDMLPLLQIVTASSDILHRTRRNRFLDKHRDIRERPRQKNLHVPSRLNRSMKRRWSPDNRCVRRIKRICLHVGVSRPTPQQTNTFAYSR